MRVQEILASYKTPELHPDKVDQFHGFVPDLAKHAGLEQLPYSEDFQPLKDLAGFTSPYFFWVE